MQNYSILCPHCLRVNVAPGVIRYCQYCVHPLHKEVSLSQPARPLSSTRRYGQHIVHSTGQIGELTCFSSPVHMLYIGYPQ